MPAWTFHKNYTRSNGTPICFQRAYLDSKVHGANIGPTWVLPAPDGDPCWPHEPCYKGIPCIGHLIGTYKLQKFNRSTFRTGTAHVAWRLYCVFATLSWLLMLHIWDLCLPGKPFGPTKRTHDTLMGRHTFWQTSIRRIINGVQNRVLALQYCIKLPFERQFIS